ncbi:MAG: SIS domain-containing protein [Firmicutes bacterium]|nr:SIS domain-containing protein [Bacillota bacterium]
MDYGCRYLDAAIAILERIKQEQYGKIKEAAEKVAEVVMAGKSIFAFGCSHASIVSQELFYRTGGFALINPIFNPTLMLDTRPATLTSKAERLPGFGREIIRESPLASGDLLIIHSVSGRNPVVIDAALEAKERGAYVVAITNMEYSQGVTSRHDSGKKLYELADLVIDNCGDFEDAAISIDGFAQKIGATSTIAGAAIGNAIVVEAAAILKARGVEPPIFHSANVDGGDEFNKKIFEKYRDRIFYML